MSRVFANCTMGFQMLVPGSGLLVFDERDSDKTLRGNRVK